MVILMSKSTIKGNVSIILCLAITVIFGITAYAIDIGLVYVEKIKLSNAIDSAALAGIIEVPVDGQKARDIAIEYLNKNGVDESQVEINIDSNSIEINGAKDVKHIFAQIIGINSSIVNASTKAIMVPTKSVTSGLRPFAVEAYDFSYGDEVTLKKGAGDGYHGNYGTVALGGCGASVLETNALYGFKGKISVGDYIDTETGNMASVSNSLKNYINSENSSFDNFERDSIRLWTVPLVDSFEVNGKNQLLVTGFGEFYVEDISKSSGKIEIIGRFIRYVINGEIDETIKDTGSYAVKLSK